MNNKNNTIATLMLLPMGAASAEGLSDSTMDIYGHVMLDMGYQKPSKTTFRLRHAYGELGPFGAGQTWTPFMDVDLLPNSLVFGPEIQWGRRENFRDGFSVDTVRVQFSVKYDFSRALGGG